MKRLSAAALTVVIVISGVSSAFAGDYKIGALEIVGPWSRVTPKGASAASGYMTIRNNGKKADRLIGGSVDVAARFQFHAMTMENDIARMRELSSVEIGPGQTIEFKPGGSHAMFVDLKRPLRQGERIAGTLLFEHAGKVQIEYEVMGMGAQHAPDSAGHMRH